MKQVSSFNSFFAVQCVHKSWSGCLKRCPIGCWWRVSLQISGYGLPPRLQTRLQAKVPNDTGSADRWRRVPARKKSTKGLWAKFMETKWDIAIFLKHLGYVWGPWCYSNSYNSVANSHWFGSIVGGLWMASPRKMLNFWAQARETQKMQRTPRKVFALGLRTRVSRAFLGYPWPLLPGGCHHNWKLMKNISKHQPILTIYYNMVMEWNPTPAHRHGTYENLFRSQACTRVHPIGYITWLQPHIWYIIATSPVFPPETWRISMGFSSSRVVLGCPGPKVATCSLGWKAAMNKESLVGSGCGHTVVMIWVKWIHWKSKPQDS